MTVESDAFIKALNTVVSEFIPEQAQGFFFKLPLCDKPLRVGYTSPVPATSAHETMTNAFFLSQIEALFAEGEAGDIWLKSSDFFSQGAEDFGFYTQEDLESGSHQTRDITDANIRPSFTFNVNQVWRQIDRVDFRDGRGHKGNKNPAFVEFKTLKKQAELKRFFHLLSYFKGPMKLWRAYYFRTNITLRAPDRASACFMAQALINSKKSLKSDTYGVEQAYRVFCSEVETENTIDAYQNEMKAIRIL